MSSNHTTPTEAQEETISVTCFLPDLTPYLNSKLSRLFLTEESEWHVTDTRFEFKIHFFGKNKDLIEIYYLSTITGKSNSVDVVTIYGSLSSSVKQHHNNTVEANRWHYLTGFFKRELRDFYENIYVGFQFIVINDIKDKHTSVPGRDLNIDFENLLNNKLFCDMTIKSVDNVELKAHKVVLASRSDVLRAHFEHDTAECITNVLETPFDSETLNELLTFIYSDKATKVDEIPDKLLAAADYYQLVRLKSICEEALHEKLTVENAIETLQLADLHSANTLKKLTLEFIKHGPAKRIMETKGWAKIESLQLVKEICKYIVDEDEL